MRRILVMVGLALLCSGIGLRAQAKAPQQLLIISAAGDPVNDQIVINGAGFGAQTSQVTLQGISLPIHSWSENQIIALYGVSTAPPGTYLLTVAKGPSPNQSDAFNLTLGGVGPKGDRGDQGDKGDQGSPGLAGEKGDKGDPGAAGATGAKGDKGDPGGAGPAGATGPAGVAGAAGPQGPVGPQGPAGNLALAGKACHSGQFVTGFDAGGNPVCGAPATPVTPRANLLVCGATSRNVTPFIPAGVSLTVVNSCVPDSNTQALLITRAGTVSTPVLQAYVNGGGIVITEYSKAASVYNAAFNGAVAQGTKIGACADAVYPVVQFNAADPLWTDSPPFSATPFAQSGCGFDISAYPGITPLGGWSSSTVSLAYRTLGLGRVWFVEADWADNQAVDFTTSNALMAYMITHR